MQVIHFTPGSLDPRNVDRRGAIASLPLANGSGEFELSALYLAPHGQISVAAQQHRQLLLVVNGRTTAKFRYGLLEPSAGVGLLLEVGEGCQLSTTCGAVVLAIEARQLEADPCGISSPDRVAGQLWPTLVSN